MGSAKKTATPKTTATKTAKPKKATVSTSNDDDAFESASDSPSTPKPKAARKKAATPKATSKKSKSGAMDAFMSPDVEMSDASSQIDSTEGTPAPNNNKTIEEIYQKKTQLEHILLRPDTYIGSIEAEEQEMYVFDSEDNTIVKKKIRYVPGLYKIIDEILVNAADNKVRPTEPPP